MRKVLLTFGGDFVFPMEFITGEAMVQQVLTAELLLSLEEWELEPEKGIAWIEIMSQKPFDADRLENSIRLVLDASPLVTAVLKVTVTPSSEDRKASVDATITSPEAPGNITLETAA